LGSSQIFGELFTFFPSQTTTHPFLQNIRVSLVFFEYQGQTSTYGIEKSLLDEYMKNQIPKLSFEFA
jgi:hypothetical protein